MFLTADNVRNPLVEGSSPSRPTNYSIRPLARCPDRDRVHALIEGFAILIEPNAIVTDDQDAAVFQRHYVHHVAAATPCFDTLNELVIHIRLSWSRRRASWNPDVSFASRALRFLIALLIKFSLGHPQGREPDGNACRLVQV